MDLTWILAYPAYNLKGLGTTLSGWVGDKPVARSQWPVGRLIPLVTDHGPRATIREASWNTKKRFSSV